MPIPDLREQLWLVIYHWLLDFVMVWMRMVPIGLISSHLWVLRSQLVEIFGETGSEGMNTNWEWCGLSFFLFIYLFFVFCFFVFRDRVSLHSPGCPETHFVDQAGLEIHRNLPASASRMLGLKACTTTPGFFFFFLRGVFCVVLADLTMTYPRLSLNQWLSWLGLPGARITDMCCAFWLFVVICSSCVFQGSISLCSSDCPRTLCRPCWQWCPCLLPPESWG